MTRFFFATGNAGKLAEAHGIFAAEGFGVSPLPDTGAPFAPEENGSTFAENAAAKAVQALEWLSANRAAAGLNEDGASFAALADDSGLCVDALDGAPGVFSARYLGEGTPYSVKHAHIIRLLDGLPDEKRTARFVCVIACAFPDGRVLTAEGRLDGIIAREPRGSGGFGYDPIFFLPEYGKTTAEIPREVKNAISHRGKALRKMCGLLAVK